MHKLIAIPATLLTASVAVAATETHSVSYSYSLADDGDIYPRLRLPGFDDMGGTRTLTGVEVRVEAEIAASLAIENMNNAPLSGWSLEGDHLVLNSLEREDPKNFGPFSFLGGLGIEPFTATLASNDGVPGSGADFFVFSDTVTIDSLIAMDLSYLDFFKGGGEVISVVGPFTEWFLGEATQYDPKLGIGDATVEFTKVSQAGTYSLVYHYDIVPEPSALVTLAGAFVSRRRRP